MEPPKKKEGDAAMQKWNQQHQELDSCSKNMNIN